MMRSLPNLLTLLLAAPSTLAAEAVVQPGDSLFAVVTHKAGLGARLAHNHLIVATETQARLDFDPADPLSARFELEAEAGALAVDPPALQERWSPRIVELGILDEPLGEVSEKDRGKIRDAMLSARQLDAGEFPQVSARVVAIEEKPSEVGGESFPYQVTLALEVHGRTVEKPVAARTELAGGELVVEAVGSFLFSDFGIKPYSAAFGAVKNRDDFHLYLHLKAELAGE